MNVYYKTLRQVTIYGPSVDKNKMLDWAYSNGYNVRLSGPPMMKDYRADLSKYMIIAQKCIKGSRYGQS